MKQLEERIFDLIEERCRDLELSIDNKGIENIKKSVRALIKKVKSELQAFEGKISDEFNQKLEQL